MVRAIEPAVRLYEEPPTEGMEVETPWADVWLGPHDWTEAFESLEPGTPHNEGRDQVWEELLTILVDKHEADEDVSEDLVRRCPGAERRARRRLRPGVAADRPDRPRGRPVVGAGVPAPVCALARGRPGEAVAAHGAAGLDAPPTSRCSTPPGSGSATRRVPPPAPAARRCGGRTRGDVAGRRPPDRDRRLRHAGDVDAARRRPARGRLVDEAAAAEAGHRPAGRPVRARRGRRGPGADRCRVADAAAPLPESQLHGRRGPRPGQARVRGPVAGPARPGRARPASTWRRCGSTTGRPRR